MSPPPPPLLRETRPKTMNRWNKKFRKLSKLLINKFTGAETFGEACQGAHTRVRRGSKYESTFTLFTFLLLSFDSFFLFLPRSCWGYHLWFTRHRDQRRPSEVTQEWISIDSRRAKKMTIGRIKSTTLTFSRPREPTRGWVAAELARMVKRERRTVGGQIAQKWPEASRSPVKQRKNGKDVQKFRIEARAKEQN